MLSMRAALLPSTPRRTLAVGVVSTLPVLVAGFLVHHQYRTLDAANFALGTTLVSVVVIPIPVLISRVIYNLRAQVRAAERLGQYTLEGKLGEGGMGVVYRANHAFLRRPTAIKLLPMQRAGATGLARFEREVLETSRLTHPNTVAIYDFGRTADGSFYYAMEYLDGVSFEQLVDHDGPQPPGRVVHLLRQACGALAEAHRRGVVHRDIKPANLQLCVRGDIPDFVKVLDFGLAKQLRGPDPLLTAVDTPLGTPHYMAPEAVTAPETVDARTDIYALGALGYFLATGSPPFRGETVVSVLANTLHVDPQPPSERLGRSLPSQFEAVILRCLAKKPEARPVSAVDLSSALTACDDVTPWTEADAARWWQERAAEVLDRSRRAQEPGASSSGDSVVAVDFQGRARPS